MALHKTVVCECGKQISTCRCPGLKNVVVSPEPCKHNRPAAIASTAATAAAMNSVIGPTNSDQLSAGKGPADAAMSPNHPAGSAYREEIARNHQELDFYRRRLASLALALGVRIDFRVFTDQEWAGVIEKFRQESMNTGAKNYAFSLADELEAEPQKYSTQLFGSMATYAHGQDDERKRIIKRLHNDITAKNYRSKK